MTGAETAVRPSIPPEDLRPEELDPLLKYRVTQDDVIYASAVATWAEICRHLAKPWDYDAYMAYTHAPVRRGDPDQRR